MQLPLAHNAQHSSSTTTVSPMYVQLTLCAHAQRGLRAVVVLSFRPSVRPSVCLSVHVSRRPISDTNGFSATLAFFVKILRSIVIA